MKLKGLLLFAALAAIASVTNASADTLLNVVPDHTVHWDLGGAPYSEILAQAFTTTSSFQNVSINAELGNDGQKLSTINAWLTTAIGPAETSADIIASTTINTSDYDSWNTIFSGLDLMPGTYYLVLSGGPTTTEGDWWGTSTTASAFESDGICYDGGAYYRFANADQLLNAPNVPFTMSSTMNLNFTVCTDPSSLATAPEPSSLALLMLGSSASLWFAKRKLAA
jgi:hypothetical protein